MRSLLLTAVLVLSACEKVDYVEIAPSEVVFKQPNNEKWMEARAMARNGVRAVKAHVEWSVKDPAIAQVNAKGLLKPLADGDTEVIAKVGDVEARVPVTVLFVDRIEVEPTELKLVEGGDNGHVKVRAFRKNGKELTDRTAVFTSSDKNIVQIAGGSDFMALDPGTATVTVQVEGARASVQVTVEADKSKK